MPIFLYHMDILPMNTISQLLSNYKNDIKGMQVFIESYKKLNPEKIKKYKDFISKYTEMEYFVNFGRSHPSKF